MCLLWRQAHTKTSRYMWNLRNESSPCWHLTGEILSCTWWSLILSRYWLWNGLWLWWLLLRRRWLRRYLFPLLFFFLDGDTRNNSPGPPFTISCQLPESCTLCEVMSNTTLPARAICP